jgi:DNA repair exonuclease SbcCD ATPase subunit
MGRGALQWAERNALVMFWPSQVKVRDSSRRRGFATVRRVLSASNPRKSDWFLDGDASSASAMRDFVSSLNIHMDNPCQFLPQERVSEFASLKPDQLLRNTERMFSKERLFERHDELCKEQREMAVRVKESDELGKRHDALSREIERMKAQVEAAKRQETQERRIKDLELFLPWLVFFEAKARFELLMPRCREAGEVAKVRSEALKKAKDAAEAANRSLAAAKEGMSSLALAFDARVKKVEASKRMMDKAFSVFSTAQRLLAEAERKEQELKSKVTQTELQLKLAEGELRDLPSMDELQAKSLEARQRQKAADEKLHEVNRERRALEDRQSGMRREFSSLEKEHSLLRRDRQIRLESLAKRESRNVALVEFTKYVTKLQADESFFGKVLGPLCLELPIHGEHAEVLGAYCDTHIAFEEKAVFLCTDERDKAALSRWRWFTKNGRALGMGTVDGGPSATQPLPGEVSGSARSGRPYVQPGVQATGFAIAQLAATSDPLSNRLTDEESDLLASGAAGADIHEKLRRGMRPLSFTASVKSRLASKYRCGDGSPMVPTTLFDELAARGGDPLLLAYLDETSQISATLVAYDELDGPRWIREGIAKDLPTKARLITRDTVVSLSIGRITKRPMVMFGETLDPSSTQPRKLMCLAGADPSRLESVQSRREALEREMDSVRSKLSEQDKSLASVREESDVAKAEFDRTAGEKKRVQVAKNKVESMRRDLATAQQELERLASASQSDHRLTCVKALADMNEAILQHEHMTERMHDQSLEYLASSRPVEAMQSVVDSKESEAESARADADTAVRLYLELKEQAVVAKRAAEDAKLKAAAVLPQDDPKYLELNTDESIPRNSGSLRDMINSLKRQIELMTSVGSAESILAKYDDLQTQLKELESRKGDLLSRMESQDRELAVRRADFLAVLESRLRVIDTRFRESLAAMHCRGCVRLSIPPDEPDNFDKWGLELCVAFRAEAEVTRLQTTVQSGGERATATMLYLLALQPTASVPFCIVDEINQGMDSSNERSVFHELQTRCSPSAASDLARCQYFMLTPKILSNLTYEAHSRVHTVFSGPYVDFPEGDGELLAFVRKAMSSDPSSLAERAGVVAAASSGRARSKRVERSWEDDE